ncbi:uncharacterized protein N7496_005574 [Penicillium cataractarum]|uniref:Rhodopsin domain-containing protein n=1 Tax=Penicillium cataractarum TaxID=2100454 RepID=A0A9W9SHM4_9EURO|nr:uncharacterized protein N7496_005574 [Penicillium cataractarum]KAJ5378165.1 hypothetical protein N7496_005574 [Penicillium cataractarum]
MTTHVALAGYGLTLMIVTWVEGAIATVLLLARVYTTWKITRHIRSDLYLALLTFVVAFISVILLTIGINYGIGAHQDQLTTEQIVAATKWSWINQAVGIFAIGTGKLALVAFLQQIHGPEHRGRVTFLWGVAMSNLILNCMTIGMIMTQCSPREKLWDGDLAGTCDGRLRNQNMAYFQGSWSALCDLILALYPVVFFWKVRLDLRVKIGLCFLMGLGVIACACSIIKTTYLRVLSQTDDVTYYLAQLSTWNETEKWVVLIVGSIPPIRPLLVIIFRRLLSTVKSSSSPQSSNVIRLTELQSNSKFSKHTTQHRHMTQGMTILKSKDSEENMLSMEEGTIIKTTNISLHYEGETNSRETGEHGGRVVPSERI